MQPMDARNLIRHKQNPELQLRDTKIGGVLCAIAQRTALHTFYTLRLLSKACFAEYTFSCWETLAILYYMLKRNKGFSFREFTRGFISIYMRMRN